MFFFTTLGLLGRATSLTQAFETLLGRHEWRDRGPFTNTPEQAQKPQQFLVHCGNYQGALRPSESASGSGAEHPWRVSRRLEA